MIILGNRTFNPVKAFDNEEKLWVYLQGRANLDSKGTNNKWRFEYYYYLILKDYMEMMDLESFHNIARQSVNQQQNIIVVHQGNPHNPQCFLVTPELDTARLKRDWSKAYAATHGLQIVVG